MNWITRSRFFERPTPAQRQIRFELISYRSFSHEKKRTQVPYLGVGRSRGVTDGREDCVFEFRRGSYKIFTFPSKPHRFRESGEKPSVAPSCIDSRGKRRQALMVCAILLLKNAPWDERAGLKVARLKRTNNVLVSGKKQGLSSLW